MFAITDTVTGTNYFTVTVTNLTATVTVTNLTATVTVTTSPPPSPPLKSASMLLSQSVHPLQSPAPAPLQNDYKFIWNDNFRGPREFNFSGTPGVQNISDNPSCPLTVLKTFLTDEIICNIVTFTNTYVEVMKNTPNIMERLQQTERSVFKLWKDVDNEDIWVYFCIIIMMGIIKKPYYHMYWTTDCLFITPIFSRLMRRDRFEQIRSMMRFTDPLCNSSGSLKKIVILRLQ